MMGWMFLSLSDFSSPICPPVDATITHVSITGPVDGKEALTRFVLVNCTASAAFGQLSQCTYPHV